MELRPPLSAGSPPSVTGQQVSTWPQLLRVSSCWSLICRAPSSQTPPRPRGNRAECVERAAHSVLPIPGPAEPLTLHPGHFSFSFLAMPVMVPPVPAEATSMSSFPGGQITFSGPRLASPPLKATITENTLSLNHGGQPKNSEEKLLQLEQPPRQPSVCKSHSEAGSLLCQLSLLCDTRALQPSFGWMQTGRTLSGGCRR
ncbi:hypothetical protein P7K49_032529 [Saguinus oedipus]|uniref:Uncharacterized protein n=1 Tax=Saguinus oedipus TaxID=9490 RepID=A0ABQ9TYI2_SAGOE|nr:hypothetical protein P7K49_032529 [Saguinus oedipus]